MVDAAADLGRRIAGEQQTFTQSLRSLVHRPPVTCGGDLPLAQAAVLMQDRAVGSVVVLDEQGRTNGIVTERDILRAVAQQRQTGDVREVMTANPFAMPAHALAYEAAIEMTERRIRHVVVMDGGQLLGVVSARDLFSVQRLGLGEITMEIRLAPGIEMLVGLAAQIRALTALLVEQGVAPEPLTMFVSVLNDRLCRRAIEIVRKRHDLERISWCWLAFGSEGRFEQTLSTDQDNGLAFVAHDAAAAPAVRERLLPFAREVNEALDACGFPLCRGNVMASNPELCLSLEEWKAKMQGWIDVTAPKALLDAAICFDFRALHGDARIADELWEWVKGWVATRPAFLRHMAEAALQARPALNRFGGFATGEAPAPSGAIDLKLHGARIFVDAARIVALALGSRQTSTAERIRSAAAARHTNEADGVSAIAAFHMIQALRLRQQVLGAPDGLGANCIFPEQLDRPTQAALKEALRCAKDLQSRLALDYQL